jgi:hypothetical protein
MKKIVRKIVSLISREFYGYKSEFLTQLRIRATESSCLFIESNSNHLTNYFSDHWKMRADVAKKIPQSGLLLEFGVNRGRSANFFCNILDENKDQRPYYGFDTFTGLTEDWGGVAPAGTFNRDGSPPNLNKRVELVIGDILDTLGPFLEKNTDPIAFIHIDTDTYTPCAQILLLAKPHLKNGSIILFDELIGYPNYQSHELKALLECLPRESYRYISFGVSHPRASLIKAAIEIVNDSVL